MRLILFLFLGFNAFGQIHAHTIPDPPTQIVYVKQCKQIDSLELDTSYTYEYFKLENEDVYLIRVRKKSPKPKNDRH